MSSAIVTQGLVKRFGTRTVLDGLDLDIDPVLRAQFWDTFTEWGEEGTTLVVSTHHLDEASRCSTLGLIRDGVIIAEGSPEAILEETGASTVEEAFLSFARRQL